MRLLVVVEMVHSLLFFHFFNFPCSRLALVLSYTLQQIKDKDKGGGLEIAPHLVETDSVTTWHQDRVVISGDEVVVGTPQRQSS